MTAPSEVNWRETLARYDSAYNSTARVTLMCGQVLHAKGHPQEAIAAYAALLEFEPDNTQCLRALGLLHRQSGNREPCRHYLSRYYQLVIRAQDLDPGTNTDLLNFYLATEGLETAPDRPPRKQVEKLFDRYASTFEDSLVGNLEYAAPSIINAFIDRDRHLQNGMILDLGCGTGLMGTQLKAFANEIHGVDLSSEMLRICAEKALYDSLTHADIHDYLSSTALSFDLIVAMEVFNYLGDLRDIFGLCRGRQVQGCRLAFTAETAGETCHGERYYLGGTGRYYHTLKYLQETAANAGYAWSRHETIVLRKEQKADVPAYLVLLEAS